MASPCVGICQLGQATGVCEGCFRDLREIATWSSLTAAERRDVLRRVAQRRQAATGAQEEGA